MKKYQVFGLLLAIAIAVVILFVTLMPAQAFASAGIGDKAAHALAFASLVFPVAFLYRQGLARAIPLAFAFGLMIEIVQPIVGRNGEVLDMAANAFGIAVGAIIGAGLRRVVLACLPERYWFWAMK